MTNYSENDIILASLIAVILVLIIFCVYICYKRKKNVKTNKNNENKERRISFGSEHSYMYNSDGCESVDSYISHDFFDNV